MVIAFVKDRQEAASNPVTPARSCASDEDTLSKRMFTSPGALPVSTIGVPERDSVRSFANFDAAGHFSRRRIDHCHCVVHDVGDEGASSVIPSSAKECQKMSDTNGIPRKAYPTDLTDEQWAIAAPLLPPAKAEGRPREVDLREVMNSILYLNRTGCQVGHAAARSVAQEHRVRVLRAVA